MKVPIESADGGRPHVSLDESYSDRSGSEPVPPVSLSTRSLKSTLIAVFGTVVCTVLGTGMLGTPAVLMQSGWIVGTLLIVGFAAAASYAICETLDITERLREPPFTFKPLTRPSAHNESLFRWSLQGVRRYQREQG